MKGMPHKFTIVSTLTIVGLSFAVGMIGLQFASAQTTSCHGYKSGQTSTTGFGSAWNIFSNGKELILKVACSSTSARVDVGSGSELQYIYNGGYWYRNGEWQSVTFTGVEKTGDWIVKNASASLPLSASDLNKDNWVVAYMCTWTGSDWKCGCADSTCSGSKGNLWNLQVFNTSTKGGESVNNHGSFPGKVHINYCYQINVSILQTGTNDPINEYCVFGETPDQALTNCTAEAGGRPCYPKPFDLVTVSGGEGFCAYRYEPEPGASEYSTAKVKTLIGCRTDAKAYAWCRAQIRKVQDPRKPLTDCVHTMSGGKITVNATSQIPSSIPGPGGAYCLTDITPSYEGTRTLAEKLRGTTIKILAVWRKTTQQEAKQEEKVYQTGCFPGGFACLEAKAKFIAQAESDYPTSAGVTKLYTPGICVYLGPAESKALHGGSDEQAYYATSNEF